MTMIHPVVLCGGSGTRLWPRSRKAMPKPFLPLVGDETLFEGTLGRCSGDDCFAAPIIVTGTDNSSGAREQGDGTGAGGDGDGTGSGRGGDGRGGLAVVSGPRHVSGAIDSARDFPIPPGGREARIGQTTTVVFTVGIDGRARNCRVRDPSNDPQADAIVCRLVESRLGFEPARNAAGQAVPSQYGWRQEWCRGRC